MDQARSWISCASTVTSGRLTLPALGMATWLKSGLLPGRIGGSGTCSESGVVIRSGGLISFMATHAYPSFMSCPVHRLDAAAYSLIGVPIHHGRLKRIGRLYR